jgi:hypothetical protein
MESNYRKIYFILILLEISITMIDIEITLSDKPKMANEIRKNYKIY